MSTIFLTNKEVILNGIHTISKPNFYPIYNNIRIAPGCDYIVPLKFIKKYHKLRQQLVDFTYLPIVTIDIIDNYLIDKFECACEMSYSNGLYVFEITVDEKINNMHIKFSHKIGVNINYSKNIIECIQIVSSDNEISNKSFEIINEDNDNFNNNFTRDTYIDFFNKFMQVVYKKNNFIIMSVNKNMYHCKINNKNKFTNRDESLREKITRRDVSIVNNKWMNQTSLREKITTREEFNKYVTR
jgi:hypothetical protein